MGLAHLIQTAWNKKSPYLILLRPLSWLYGFGFWLNKTLYQRQIKSAYQAPIPVMVIGNITVGGSGKTPLLIALVKYLQQKNIRIGVISRGYGGQGEFPAIVYPHSLPSHVGDEPCLIAQATAVPMAVGANRQHSIELLLQHFPDLQLIISDDGLQHWALKRQIEWIVLDSQRGLGNEKLLPEGFLREPVSRLDGATVIEHAKHTQRELNMYLEVGTPYRLMLNESIEQNEPFNPKQAFHAVVGIGYPERFFNSLTELGVEQFQQHPFADHHHYQLQDIEFKDNLAIITTEKDAVKLRVILQNSPLSSPIPPIWVVPVQAKLSSMCYDVLSKQLAEQGISVD